MQRCIMRKTVAGCKTEKKRTSPEQQKTDICKEVQSNPANLSETKHGFFYFYAKTAI